MNILTFDIEEWYIEKEYKGDNKYMYNYYNDMLSRILDLLEQYSIKATFFCLGALAKYFPYVIKKICERGHEIGCHSNYHKWINKMTPDEFLIDTRSAIFALEDCCGKKIKSFRAPAFSIGENNKWAFGILSECGIENDASIFPGIRDFGGFPSFTHSIGPCKIEYGSSIITEFPVSMGKLPIIKRDIAYSGGGYFRLMPISFVKHMMNNSNYVMCYFHIADLLDIGSPFMNKKQYEEYFKESGTVMRRVKRYFKSNIGRKRAFSGLKELLDNYSFICIEDAHIKELTTLPLISI